MISAEPFRSCRVVTATTLPRTAGSIRHRRPGPEAGSPHLSGYNGSVAPGRHNLFVIGRRPSRRNRHGRVRTSTSWDGPFHRRSPPASWSHPEHGRDQAGGREQQVEPGCETQAPPHDRIGPAHGIGSEKGEHTERDRHDRQPRRRSVEQRQKRSGQDCAAQDASDHSGPGSGQRRQRHGPPLPCPVSFYHARSLLQRSGVTRVAGVGW